MPILSSAVFDDGGKPYDVSRILSPKFLFDREAYENYSKVYLPITYVLSYGVQFASLSALVTHTACWHGRDILRESKRSLRHPKQDSKTEYSSLSSRSCHNSVDETMSAASGGEPLLEPDATAPIGAEDVHWRLMKHYEDAPIMWYLATFLVMLAMGVFVVE